MPRAVDLRTAAAPSLPLALARLHWATPVQASVTIRVSAAANPPGRLTDLLVGAGFEVVAARRVRVDARRVRTLPDTVGPGMRVLVCGLNPSLVAADAGYGYAGRSNRFWPAALAAGLVTRRNDPVHALLSDAVGMTDLVKRPTPSAGSITPEEYEGGVGRVSRLVEWLQPGLVLFVGLAGWRAAVDKWAQPGWQPSGFAGARAYLMPSTSGLNAHTPLPALVEHLRTALAVA